MLKCFYLNYHRHAAVYCLIYYDLSWRYSTNNIDSNVILAAVFIIIIYSEIPLLNFFSNRPFPICNREVYRTILTWTSAWSVSY